jgi:cyclopropane fatty-acyl-phospholipid synthase-like methyltransferase
VAGYYDRHQLLYTLFWSRAALHYGFWYDRTRRLSDAVTNTDKFVIEVLNIRSNDIVLDAGCGVAGSCIYIAKATGARVEGITVSRVQAAIATRRIVKAKMTSHINVSQQDYTQTNFAAETFTKIFAIEASCHAVNKHEFLSEAFRVLKPGGSIAIVDGYLTKRCLSSDEQQIYDNAIAGWLVPWLPTLAHFRELLGSVGFTSVKFYDMQKFIWPSIRRIYYGSLLTRPFNALCAGLRLVRPNSSAYFQKLLFEKRLATYGVFVAHKLEQSEVPPRAEVTA